MAAVIFNQRIDEPIIPYRPVSAFMR